jgi:hypothetical protein
VSVASDRLWVSTRKGLFEVARGTGWEWRVARTHFLGDRVSLTLVDRRDGAIYAALDHGHFGVKLHRSDDGGATFQEIAAPAYPPAPAGGEKMADGREWPWSLKLIWALAAAGDDRPGSLWCGTIPGGLFRSDDRGASWQLCEGLWHHPLRKEWFGGGADYPGIHSICVDPRDSRRVLVGVSCGGVWQTCDGGATWETRSAGMKADFMPPERAEDPAIQDPHMMAMCPAAPDRLYVQHHCGMYRSRDGAASWQPMTGQPSSFGFAVVVHPTDPDRAWFVPAVKDEHRIPVDGKVVVSRTRDGGETFEVLRSGLPQEHAYDLTYRHGLAIDPSGDRLAFGSTTGSLWVSEDGGERFVDANHHLPPIAAVTFG